jgi:long-chain acyl-CoA synthetase
MPTPSRSSLMYPRIVAAAGNPRAIFWQDEFGQWQPISSDQIYQRVRALAGAFLAWGAQKGDRIALIGENRWEWAVTDFAALAIGAIDVPIYPTLTGEQVAGAGAGCRLPDCRRFHAQQFDKLNAVREQTQLERIVIMDSAAPPEGAIPFSEVLAGADAHGSEHDPVFDALVSSVEPKDLATLIYTSGTTGEPKGVRSRTATSPPTRTMLPRISTSIRRCLHLVPASLAHHRARAGLRDVQPRRAGGYCSQFDKLPAGDAEIRPTVFVGVPRVYEKIRQAVEQKSFASPVKKRLRLGIGPWARIAIRFTTGASRTSMWKLANKLAYSKVQRGLRRPGEDLCRPAARRWASTPQWFASVGLRFGRVMG